MGKFIIKKAKNGVKFTLKASNGQPIGQSEVFSSMKACVNSIASVGKCAKIAKLEDQTLVKGFDKQKNPKFQVYTDKKGEIRFRLLATNGENILASEGYRSKKSCMKGIASVITNAKSETVDETAKK